MHSFLDVIYENDYPEEAIELLRAGVVTKHIPKGYVLQRNGDIGGKAFFVKSGCLRSYAIDEKDKEHIFMFAPEGWIITDVETVVSKGPAQLYIDAIEDSEIEVLDVAVVSLTNIATPFMLQKLNKRISVLQKRIIMLMSATLQERYLHFLETYPDIVQRVPQKMIASYLGVTPEALSKARGDLSKIKP